MRYCHNCGNQVDYNTYVCPHCGTRLSEMPYPNAKSKVAAGVLGILLGGLGIHNFYLGFVGKGVAQLLLSVLTCGFLAPIAAIWGLVEGILILTGSIDCDAQGVPLRD